MPINHYFQGGQGIGNAAEKRLHEDLIVEGLKIYGQDVFYLPRTLVNKDLILGEDVTSKFDDSFSIEMYFENNTGFAGEQEIISKFGLEIIFRQPRFINLIFFAPEILIGSHKIEFEFSQFLSISFNKCSLIF